MQLSHSRNRVSTTILTGFIFGQPVKGEHGNPSGKTSHLILEINTAILSPSPFTHCFTMALTSLMALIVGGSFFPFFFFLPMLLKQILC